MGCNPLPVLDHRDFNALYRAHSSLVRRCVQHKQIQDADQEDIAQTVWTQVLKGWPSPPPDDEVAYLTAVAKNAVRRFWETKFAKKRDERRTMALAEEDSVGPIDAKLVEKARVEGDVSLARLREHFHVIANKLPLEIRVLVRKLLTNPDAVPRRERETAIDALCQAMKLPARPRSVEYPGESVEGPSHCGRTARRLRQEDAANGEDRGNDEEDAAE
jgi:DNA-directed RNA polymerase specialized sigma24 family protein